MVIRRREGRKEEGREGGMVIRRREGRKEGGREEW